MSEQTRKLLFFAILGLVVWQVVLGGKLPNVVPVVKPGPRQLLIFHQQEKATTPWTNTVTDLQTNKYFVEHKHPSPLIIDLDSKDSKGQPSPIVTKWKPEITGLTPPVVLVLESPSKKLVAKQSVPPDASADAVLEVLKKAGG